jgi:hypothetical protein
MRQASRHTILHEMIKLRRPHLMRTKGDKDEGAEDILLEITKLAFIVQAEVFPCRRSSSASARCSTRRRRILPASTGS